MSVTDQELLDTYCAYFVDTINSAKFNNLTEENFDDAFVEIWKTYVVDNYVEINKRKSPILFLSRLMTIHNNIIEVMAELGEENSEEVVEIMSLDDFDQNFPAQNVSSSDEKSEITNELLESMALGPLPMDNDTIDDIALP